MITSIENQPGKFIIKFGYGDVLVGANELTKELFFQSIDQPMKCGDVFKDNCGQKIGDTYNINMDYAKYVKFMKYLFMVERREITKFEIDDIIFDFETFNEMSIEVCRAKAFIAISTYVQTIAC